MDGGRIQDYPILSEAQRTGDRAARQGRLWPADISSVLFQIPESAPLTSGKCRDGAISQEKTLSPGMQSVSTSETIRPDGLPVSLATYKVSSKDGSTEYVERGFVATGDICGDLAFYSKRPIGDGDTDLKEIFSTYKLDAGYTPRFDDVLLYAQVLYQTQLYKAAAPTFEKALTMLPKDGAPFPSARIASRIVTDQAGMSYGMAGELTKARAIFEKGVAEDPDYPMYYYNLACADAGEKKGRAPSSAAGLWPKRQHEPRRENAGAYERRFLSAVSKRQGFLGVSGGA